MPDSVSGGHLAAQLSLTTAAHAGTIPPRSTGENTDANMVNTRPAWSWGCLSTRYFTFSSTSSRGMFVAAPGRRSGSGLRLENMGHSFLVAPSLWLKHLSHLHGLPLSPVPSGCVVLSDMDRGYISLVALLYKERPREGRQHRIRDTGWVRALWRSGCPFPAQARGHI